MHHVLPVHRRAFVAIVAALLLTTALAAPATATQPGPNGRIAFMRFDGDGQFQIWTANPDPDPGAVQRERPPGRHAQGGGR